MQWGERTCVGESSVSDGLWNRPGMGERGFALGNATLLPRGEFLAASVQRDVYL